jgi:hypothetical protein
MNLFRPTLALVLTLIALVTAQAQVPTWPKTTPAEVTAAGIDVQLIGADYGNGTFVLSAYFGGGNAVPAITPAVYTSPDGVTWTRRTIPGSGRPNVPRFLNGKFYLGVEAANGGNGVILSSADGITWASTGVLASSLNAANEFAYGNGLYLACASRSGTTSTYQILTSSDGATWTPRAIVSGSSTSHITYFNGKFYATVYNSSSSSTDGLYTSADTVTWTRVAGAPGGPGLLAAGPGTLLVTYYSGGVSGQSLSTDGVTFATATPGITMQTETIYDLTLARASADGRTWASIGSTTNLYYGPEVAYGNGIYVFVGEFNVFAGSTTVAAGGNTTPAPAITAQPTASQDVALGGSITFTVTVTGTGVTYQWYFNGIAISGAVNFSYTLSNLVVGNAGSYTVTITNAGGSITSRAAVLTVGGQSNPAPSITKQPVSHTVIAGSSVVASVEVSGTGLTYQWKKGGVAISGATFSQVFLSNAQASDAGSYTVTITNASGSVTSTPAVLTVNAAGSGVAPRGLNLSVRTSAGTGDNTLIVGAVVGGAGTSGTKPLLIRAVGPTLTGYGVTGALADPTLDFLLQGATTPLASNDNWGGAAQITTVGNAVGAFPFASATSADAALYLTPTSGAFSVKVSGVGGATGIALAEIYDASGVAYTPTTPRFINFSARAQVGTGAGVLIAGFVIEGSAERTVLIRAVGPTLATYGVSGVLLDPLLELTQTVGGATVNVASNDNWGGDAQIAGVGTAVGAFALGSATSKDAAILVTLPPGVYSAKASGVGGTTGVALIEVYEVP